MCEKNVKQGPINARPKHRHIKKRQIEGILSRTVILNAVTLHNIVNFLALKYPLGLIAAMTLCVENGDKLKHSHLRIPKVLQHYLLTRT